MITCCSVQCCAGGELVSCPDPALTRRAGSGHETSGEPEEVRQGQRVTSNYHVNYLLLDISVHFIWSFMQCKVKVHDVLLKLPYRACFTEGTAAI